MPDNRQLEILSDLIKTAEQNFDAAAKHTATVDDKAQKTSALAGIFLAVAFGFVKPESLTALSQQYGDISLLLLYLDLILFVAAVGLCLRAMWLRKVPIGGVSVRAHERVAREIFSFTTKSIDDDLIAAYRENLLLVWKAAIGERFSANIQKTHLVHQAQRFLALGILVATLNLALLGFATTRSAIPSKQGNIMPDDNPRLNKSKYVPVGGQLTGEDPHLTRTPAGDALVVDEHGNILGALRPLPPLPEARRQQLLKTIQSPEFTQAQIASLDRLE